jgi:Leucine-rich repeat (LRR) protein
MNYPVSSSSLSSFSTSSTSSSSTLNASSVSSPIVMSETWTHTSNDPVGLISSFLPKRAQILGNVKKFKGVLKTEYSKTLEVFKNKVGAQNYSGISATAISNLKRVIPKDLKAFEKISENKTLLAKRIFCNLFGKIKFMDGDDFLKSLFPDEDITSSSKVIDYSIDPDILEKMHRWIEDINLIIMMKHIARRNIQVFQGLEGLNLLADIDCSSLETVHARAQSFRAWISGKNNNVLLNVTVLNLANLGLTSLPSEIDKFINLQRLVLHGNNLTHLPDTIGNLGNLQDLYLYNNLLTHLPDTIGNLGHLQALYLQDNHLTQLPDTIGNLRNLLGLYLDNNHLTQLPNTIGNLGNLGGLYLSNNHLTQLPDSIGNLANLKWIILLENHLTHLPDSIGNLGNLQQLDLPNNLLTQLPDSIGNLGNLQKLDLSNNLLTYLPDTIGNLGNLRRFYLSNNLLTHLPDMTNLSEGIRKKILKNSSRKAQVFYFLKARVYSLITPYLPKKETVINAVASVAFVYLTYTYFSSND